MKKLIPLFLTVILSACGGGGGGGGGGGPSGTSPASNPNQLSFTSSSIALNPRLAYANFGSEHVVMSGIYLGPNATGPANPDAPLKIFKVTASGLSDVTSNILGANNTAPGYAVIADFNGDGVDDIFTGYLKDYPYADSNGNEYTGNSVVFLSRPNQPHLKVTIPGANWSHQLTAADIDNDGDVDVINSQGKIWVNNGSGNFTFKDNTWSSAYWMNGSGVCAGQFANSTQKQLIITDQMLDSQRGPIADTVMFDFDSNIDPVAVHTLPVPILDIGNMAAERSHDVGCVAVDINHDGLLDTVVFSRPFEWVNNTWNTAGTVQVLINQGNYQFADQTSSMLVNSNVNAGPAYNYVLKDFNGDGVMDVFADTQLFLNINNKLVASTLPNVNATSMIPVAVPGGYKMFYVTDSIGNYTVNLTDTVVNFH